MTSLRDTIQDVLRSTSQRGRSCVSEAAVVESGVDAGFDPSTVTRELAEMVDEGIVREENGSYAWIGGGEAEMLSVATYRGSSSTPWQFVATRTGDCITVQQARGPEEQFDPVVRVFDIEAQRVADESVEFHHAAVRRVWSEEGSDPHVQSQRSESRTIEFLYRDGEGWHFAQPVSAKTQGSLVDTDGFEPTTHPGLMVSATYLRSETESAVQFTEERTYRVTPAFVDAYPDVYVLSCVEVNEESTERLLWEVEDAVAYRLITHSADESEDEGRTAEEQRRIIG